MMGTDILRPSQDISVLSSQAVVRSGPDMRSRTAWIIKEGADPEAVRELKEHGGEPGFVGDMRKFESLQRLTASLWAPMFFIEALK